MPDSRLHRGPHPEDEELFSPSTWTALRAATSDLSWLLTRGYAINSALKIVGDRYSLAARQRTAVARCACSDEAIIERQKHRVEPDAIFGEELWIDGYNVITSVEAALAGGVILHARDGCYRDMASMHGSYRKVEETIPAIRLLGELIDEIGVASCHWLLDSPVSNSGRLKTMLLEIARDNNWNWQIELVRDPDYDLSRIDHVVASADSQILDRAARWFNLARLAIDQRIPTARFMDLSN